MSGGQSRGTSSVGPADGRSSRKLTVDADDVAWQQNGDYGASLEHGCLKLGDEDIGEDNNNVELRSRRRFPSYLYENGSITSL